MEQVNDVWDVLPNELKNFECRLKNTGLWRLEKPPIFGKWIFVINKTGFKDAPTFADQKNFFTGLLEAEWRNDNFVFPNTNIDRSSQREKTLKKFEDMLEEI